MDKAMVGFAILFIFAHALSFAMEGVKGTVTTTLSVPLGVASTTMTVGSTADFPAAGVLTVDEEIISYTAKTATTFTGLTRGGDDTDPVGHVPGVAVNNEALGLITNVLDFRAAQSDVPFFGFAITGFNIGGMFFKFLVKMVIWDYAWFDTDIMGIPMSFVQYFLYALSVGLIWRIFVIFRGAG